MTKIAIYVITILVAFLFAMTAPSWQVSVANRGNAASQLARKLLSGESSTPSSPVNIIDGRNIYHAACADCHGSGHTEFGIGAGHPVSNAQHSPRDIHHLITFGGEDKSNENAEYSGSPFEIEGEHPVYPAQLTDTERWAVSVYLTSASLDKYAGDDDPSWIQSWRNQLDPPDPATSGQLIYRENCATCHGPGGYGNGPLASDLAPRPANLRDTVWLANQSDIFLFSIIRDGKLTFSEDDSTSTAPDNESWTGMPSWGGYLTDDQIIDLVNHIRSFSYLFTEPGRSIEDYKSLQPDNNQWEWAEISRLLPDAPEITPDWMQGNQN
ncbi:MAG: c-type cytochrome [bacterium]|nr:c-type cytochrome [bacterium]